MIDISQWRASIGHWSCLCIGQTKVAIKGDVTSDVTLFIVFSLLLIFVKSSTSNSPKTGVHYCQTPFTRFAMRKWMWSVFGDYNNLVLIIVSFLLLLSGNVELNPGPTLDDRPTLPLLLEWLEPLVDWQSFSVYLPGIKQHHIEEIEQEKMLINHQKRAIFSKWFDLSPKGTISWRDVIYALERRNENGLVHDILQHLKEDTALSTALIRKRYTTSSKRYHPYEITKHHVSRQQHEGTCSMSDTSLAHNAEPLIVSIDINMLHTAAGHRCIASPPISASPSTEQTPSFFVRTGAYIIQSVKSLSNYLMFGSTPTDVRQYSDIMRDRYKYQPIVATDWPPQVKVAGKDFFGRLVLIETQDSFQQGNVAWYLLRGKVDRIPKLPGCKEIAVKDILKPCGSYPLRVVVEGPPGIGKTTLCRKLCNMWANKIPMHQQYDLVLYCPLRNSKIAQATTLTDLCMYNSPNKIPRVGQWITDTEGKGLLIIFDGWDELSIELRDSSLAASIIRRDQLAKCSVIVTSRSYASSSLLKLDSLSRHVQVIGFTEEEIAMVVKETLKDKDPQLAVKLIDDLKVRGDVQSLCYIPLVCSMVILVYSKLGGRLPTTLTELYKNFILQTIRRHVERTSHHNVSTSDPTFLSSLSTLPLRLDTAFKEMCHLAYTNLMKPRMIFNHHQLQVSLNVAIKEDYLGLITSFNEHDEKLYQFLHLSIQEFLGAFWIISMKTDSEPFQVFQEHFDDDHFRMCLRFVAGLTHLEPEGNYQQYFNKPLDLQCKRMSLTGFETYRDSFFYQNPQYNHNNKQEHFPLLLFQLLYESQNTKLCQKLARSINQHSMCLHGVQSLFDSLCLSYFINNSLTRWNNLFLGSLNHQSISVFTSKLSLSSKHNQCKRLEFGLYESTDATIQTLLQPSLFHNIQECYCTSLGGQQVVHILLDFLDLPQIKILHLEMNTFEDELPITSNDDTDYSDKYYKIEECLANKSVLQEMRFKYIDSMKPEQGITAILTTSSIIKGIARSKSISSLTLDIPAINPPSKLPDSILEHLLKDNHTLQALTLDIPDTFLPSSLNIAEVNTPLIALKIKRSDRLTSSLLPHVKGLRCLTLCGYNIPHDNLLALLFTSNLCLQSLSLSLNTLDSVTTLFTALQTNTTLKGLQVDICRNEIFGSDIVCTSMQDMLIHNQTLQYLNITSEPFSQFIPSAYLSFLAAGLFANNNLHELIVPVPLVQSTHSEQIKSLFNILSQKSNLIQLHVNFKLDESFLVSNLSFTEMFYEQGLPAVIDLLQSQKTIRLLKIKCELDNKSSHPNWIKLGQLFYETIFLHSSLEYIDVSTGFPFHPVLKDTFKAQEETLIALHRQHQPLKPLPVVDLMFLKI